MQAENSLFIPKGCVKRVMKLNEEVIINYYDNFSIFF